MLFYLFKTSSSTKYTSAGVYGKCLYNDLKSSLTGKLVNLNEFVVWPAEGP